MSESRWICGCGCLWVVSVLACGGGVWSAPPVAVGQLTVDVVSLKSGKSLRGSVVESRADGSLLLVVSADWLERQDPARFASTLTENQETQRQAWEATLERLSPWISSLVDAPRLKFFLEQEQQRLQKLQARDEPPVSEFLWIELMRQEIGRAIPAAPERRRIAALSWYSGIKDVEQRSVASLKKELAELDFPADAPVPDLGSRLPARIQSDTEWNARRALIAHALHESLDFQGMGGVLARTGEQAAIDWSAILPGLLQDQSQVLLDELTGIPSPPADERQAWLKRATGEARKLNRSGFRVTRVSSDPLGRGVTVNAEFVARVDDEHWKVLWSTKRSADSSAVRIELEDQISADPQVRKVLRAFQALGVVSDEAISTAIRHGAAVMDAQALADADFFEFRDRYLQRVDGPYLLVP